jgi:hypothetical protein
MGDLPIRSDLEIPFPVEFLIQDTPLSHQAKSRRAKE